ncbi:hypothetical protein JW824_11030 [bacterium]|nr:hypothetical protein [bacterium]
MIKDTIIKKPYLILIGDMGYFECVLSDIKLIHKKTEEIEFTDFDITEDIDQEVLITYSFPDIPRYGFLVTLMIIAENEFRNICKTLDILEEYPVKWNQISGNAFEKLLIFAEKFSELNIDVDKNTRDRIRGLIETRNCIVHSNSYIPDYRKQTIVRDFVNKLSGCSIEDGFIHLSYEGCFECADLIEGFVKAAYKAAMHKYPEDKDE